MGANGAEARGFLFNTIFHQTTKKKWKTYEKCVEGEKENQTMIMIRRGGLMNSATEVIKLSPIVSVCRIFGLLEQSKRNRIARPAHS